MSGQGMKRKPANGNARRGVIVAGTGTGIGKTVFAAGLAAALDGAYWKPVQSGRDEDGGTDSERARFLSGLPAERILPERYVLATPVSPHRAAEIDGVEIEAEVLEPLPESERPLIVELAGGLMVPLTRRLLQIEMVARWGLPVVLVARTELGTINHTLLSVEALRARGIALHGIAFIGPPIPDTEETIAALADARRLGRLPVIQPLDAATLKSAFAAAFRVEDFA